jgi:hypothetical protein
VLSLPRGLSLDLSAVPGESPAWERIDAERKGFVNISRGHGTPQGVPDLAWLKTRIDSDHFQMKHVTNWLSTSNMDPCKRQGGLRGQQSLLPRVTQKASPRSNGAEKRFVEARRRKVAEAIDRYVAEELPKKRAGDMHRHNLPSKRTRSNRPICAHCSITGRARMKH